MLVNKEVQKKLTIHIFRTFQSLDQEHKQNEAVVMRSGKIYTKETDVNLWNNSLEQFYYIIFFYIMYLPFFTLLIVII